MTWTPLPINLVHQQNIGRDILGAFKFGLLSFSLKSIKSYLLVSFKIIQATRCSLEISKFVN